MATIKPKELTYTTAINCSIHGKNIRVSIRQHHDPVSYNKSWMIQLNPMNEIVFPNDTSQAERDIIVTAIDITKPGLETGF